MVHHTRQDALTDPEFEQLIDTSHTMGRIRGLETRFVLLVCGRLGLRRGELTHMQSDWINWRKQRIDIPSHDPCSKGRNGGPCGNCKQLAQQTVDHNDHLDFDDALSDRWVPKTDAAVRSVPFGFAPRVEIVLQDYFEEFDQWMYTGQAINRRINTVVDQCSAVDKHVYPHALRATAATYHAGRGLDTLSLQALMGWADASTARNYIAQNADNLDRNLQFIHS